MFYQTHIFCCTNRRPDGHKRSSCAQKGSESLRNYMKEKAAEMGLPESRINSAGCLNRCELGPTMVVYPEGIWYRAGTKEDIDTILLALKEGRIEESLRLPDEAK
jgi:(2Fe-2S) ferredoxin